MAGGSEAIELTIDSDRRILKTSGDECVIQLEVAGRKKPDEKRKVPPPHGQSMIQAQLCARVGSQTELVRGGVRSARCGSGARLLSRASRRRRR